MEKTQYFPEDDAQRIRDLTAERDYYKNALREIFDQLHKARWEAARAELRLLDAKTRKPEQAWPERGPGVAVRSV